MDDRQPSDATARNRWVAINLVRLTGVAMVAIGILIVRGVIVQPAWVGYLLLAAGLFDVFAMPQILARKWRSPRE